MKLRSMLRSPRCCVPGLCLLLALLRGSLAAQPVTAWVDPASASVALGSSNTFCIVAQGNGPLSFQWQKNGHNLPGQTNACLTLTNITIADGGSYRATVLNPSGALVSEEASMLVLLNFAPGGDAFGNGRPITAASNSIRGISAEATREPGEPAHSSLITSNSVWYVWTAPGSGIVTFDTQGSTFDTVLAVYTGSNLTGLTEVANDDDSGGFHTSKVVWNAQAGTEYRIVIDGVTGETGTYVCEWNLESASAGHVPLITRQPRSQTVIAGDAAIFDAAATDPDPYPRFQWFHNGIAIPGATSPRLTLPSVRSAELGQYYLTVTNSTGRGITSKTADLEIGPFPSVQSRDKLAEVPPGGTGARLAPQSGGGSGGTFSIAAGTIINQRFFSAGTTDRCEPAHCGVPGGASRWFQLIADSDGICSLDTQGSDVDTVLAVYLQNFSICTNLYEPLVDCNNDVVGSCDQLLAQTGSRDRGSRLSFLATAGTVYRAVVDCVGGVRGTNVQFNVHFQSEATLQEKEILLGAAEERFLQMRGSSVALRVATNPSQTNSSYQWELNDRRIAGALRERLVIPFLNYSDAGRYSVRFQQGTNQIRLPGAVVAVVDPCQEGMAARSAGSASNFQLLGAAPETISLEAVGALGSALPWDVVGTIPASREPTLWNVSTGLTGFYRLARPPP